MPSVIHSFGNCCFRFESTHLENDGNAVMTQTSRRTFLKSIAATTLVAGTVQAATKTRLHIACNQFCWINMYGRDKKVFNADLDTGFGQVKQSGMDGLESMLGDVQAVEQVIPLLIKHGLEMRSFYTGATLHEPASAEASIERVVATAKRSKELIDVQIVVVNPTPLKNQAKSDEQLACQADAMNRLGGRLAEIGTTLAYHFHAPAWQSDGREFHQLMNETDPQLVKLCLDTHWVYRGSGNSAPRVHEVIERYGRRVAELHLRQSTDGVWTECMSDGDIDYRRVADELQSQGVHPLLVLEQAVEKGTPNTMDAIESHRRSRTYVEGVFAGFSS
jgi:inosose dehydratase